MTCQWSRSFSFFTAFGKPLTHPPQPRRSRAGSARVPSFQTPEERDWSTSASNADDCVRRHLHAGAHRPSTVSPSPRTVPVLSGAGAATGLRGHAPTSTTRRRADITPNLQAQARRRPDTHNIAGVLVDPRRLGTWWARTPRQWGQRSSPSLGRAEGDGDVRGWRTTRRLRRAREHGRAPSSLRRRWTKC